MTPKKYLEKSKRTAPDTYQNIATVKRIEKFPVDMNVDLIHGALGLQTESAEFSDALKRHLFYGKDLDRVNIIEEMGDQLFYMAMILRAVDSSFEEAMDKNIKKLEARFPDKFTEDKAINRNLKKEREILEE